jgi:hypothetical protein
MLKYRGNVKLPMLIIEHHTMQTYGGVEVLLHAFEISVLNEDESSVSCPCLFISGGRYLLFLSGLSCDSSVIRLVTRLHPVVLVCVVKTYRSHHRQIGI